MSDEVRSTTNESKMFLPRVTRHALQEKQPGLLVEDGVRWAARVARHELLRRVPDLSFTTAILSWVWSTSHLNPYIGYKKSYKTKCVCGSKMSKIIFRSWTSRSIIPWCSVWARSLYASAGSGPWGWVGRCRRWPPRGYQARQWGRTTGAWVDDAAWKWQIL